MSSGFSLFELIITLAITTILLTIAVPSFEKYQAKSQEQVVMMQLLHAANLTRSEAISRHEKIMLCESNNQKTCQGDWQDGYIISTTTGKVLHVFQPISANGKLFWRAFPKWLNHLEFLPSGLPYGQNGTFWYCLQYAVHPDWAIVMNRSGRMRIALSDKSGKIVDDVGKTFGCT